MKINPEWEKAPIGIDLSGPTSVNVGPTPKEMDGGLCAVCGGTCAVDSGGVTPWGAPITMPCPACHKPELADLVEIGKRWLANSSLEEWFPFTAEEQNAGDAYSTNPKP